MYSLRSLSTEMNSRYTKILNDSIELHKFQWLGLVLEYANASYLPAPASLLEDLYVLLFAAAHWLTHCFKYFVNKNWPQLNKTFALVALESKGIGDGCNSISNDDNEVADPRCELVEV